MSSQKAREGNPSLKRKILMKNVVKDLPLSFFPLERSQWPLGI